MISLVSVTILSWFCVGALGVGALLLFRSQKHAVDQAIADSLRHSGDMGAATSKASSSLPIVSSKERLLRWGVGVGCAVATRAAVGTLLTSSSLLWAALGGILGEISYRRRERSALARRIRRLEFHIPTVMERVVMAVGAGLDIVPAIHEASAEADDPASEILQRAAQLMNSGLSLEDSLQTATAGVACPALQHISVHLALAYRQGGELVRPLRELSDATQSYYQETVEEEIARLPVKAVMPLILTFAGLLVCFLIVPLLQVASLADKVSHVQSE